MHTLKNLAIAAAMVGLVASAQAEYYPGSTDFEERCQLQTFADHSIEDVQY